MSARIEELLEHTAWIRRLAERLAGDATRAEDLVQETWLAALRRPPDAGRPAKPWLARVLANLAKNQRRAGRRRERREELAAEPALAPAADDVVTRADTQRALVVEVLALDEPYRTAVLSRYFDELTPAEIAQRAGVPAATVRSWLMRGLAQLRERLDEQPGGRERWAPALLLVARAPLGTAGKGTTLWMATTMSTSTAVKAALAAGCLVAAWAFGQAWWSRGEPSAPRPAAIGAAQPGAETRAQSSELRAAESDAERAAAASSSERMDEVASLPDPDAEPAPAVANARCLDEQGLPLAGVRLWTLHDEELERALSGPDGRVTLRIRPARSWRMSISSGDEPLRTMVPYRFSAPDVVSHQIDALASAGGTTELGDVVLRRAGRIAGHVVDEHGTALAGALVQSVPAAEEAQAEHGAPVGSEERFAGYEPVHSGLDGSFELVGVAPGFARVSVALAGYHEFTSATLAVAAGAVASCGELALRAVAHERSVRGIVVGPENEPVAGALVAWSSAERSGAVASDDTGQFVVALDFDAMERVTLVASDPAKRLAPAAALEALPGGPPVTLQLVRGKFVELHVRTQAGKPVDAFAWSFVAASDGAKLAHGTGYFAGGVVRELLPAQPFRAAIDLTGFEPAASATIAPETAPEVLELVLVRHPGVSGRVTCGGAPVAGAQVQLLLPLDDTVAVADGFWNILSPHSGSVSRTDADGRFDAIPPAPRVYLRVRANGCASALVGPLEIDMLHGLAGLEVELGRGGAIAGRVIAGPEVDPASIVVGACRGDGVVLTTRPDASGEYRFEHLAPGPWQVGLCAEDRNPDMSVPWFRVAPRPAELSHQVEVREGATERFDVVRERACRLVGRLTLRGAAPGPFEVELRREGAEYPLHGRTTDPDGGFEVESPEPGPHVLVLRLAGTELERPLELWRGENAWREDLP